MLHFVSEVQELLIFVQSHILTGLLDFKKLVSPTLVMEYILCRNKWRSCSSIVLQRYQELVFYYITYNLITAIIITRVGIDRLHQCIGFLPTYPELLVLIIFLLLFRGSWNCTILKVSAKSSKNRLQLHLNEVVTYLLTYCLTVSNVIDLLKSFISEHSR